MPSFAIDILLFMIAIFLLAISLFFTAFPGREFIQAKFAIRKLRVELEPVARALDAKTKIEWDSNKRAMLYFFEFPNEPLVDIGHLGEPHPIPQWITLIVSNRGLNIYTPSFSPPAPASEKINILLKTLQKMK
jgi:hypothetical protein